MIHRPVPGAETRRGGDGLLQIVAGAVDGGGEGQALGEAGGDGGG
jgi:hypothetical protein